MPGNTNDIATIEDIAAASSELACRLRARVVTMRNIMPPPRYTCTRCLARVEDTWSGMCRRCYGIVHD